VAYANKLFTTNAISRKNIADDLNEYLEENGVGDDGKRYLEDDDRLTDEVCAAYAAAIGNLDEDLPESLLEEEYASIKYTTLTSLGCIPKDEPEEQAAQMRRVVDPQHLYPIFAVEVLTKTAGEAARLALEAMMGCSLDKVDVGVVRESLRQLICITL
jgi:hypothetical protein